MTSPVNALEPWRYSINYGPDGEANYAFVYDGSGDLVSNLKIHHAVAVVEQMNRRALPLPADLEEWEKLAEGVTPGPWVDGPYGDVWVGVERRDGRWDEVSPGSAEIISGMYTHKAEDRAWIAACSPDRILSLVRELAEARKAREWLPIESAPKDGTEIIARRSSRFAAFSCWWQNGEWLHYDHDDGLISHRPNEWMPLPSALSSESETSKETGR